MKERILTGWTFRRGIYLLMGSLLIIQAVMEKQWIGVVLGGYFAAMGIFSFGCAAGNCSVETKQKGNETIQDVQYEEVKTK